MKQQELLHEGKSKLIYKGEDSEHIVIRFKDDVTAFYNIKRAKIENKARMNCTISSLLLAYLNENGIKTHFVERLDDESQLCRMVKHIPIEVIVRNVIAGSMAKRLGIEEGVVPQNTIFDLCLREEQLGDPLINDHHVVALGIATYEELAEIYEISAKVNLLLSDLFAKAGIRLVDFKIEFGRTDSGELILTDELTPDTCRLWDAATGDRLDKDRFRRDLGRVRETYEDVANRIHNALNK
ncbi:MAG: phosphoribosylaminoimidazolesuccinocarboxamide synthase [Alistipes sp.]|jgi:phosphoribosylaminoimidazole-succinocarboxamide synthase|nr:phosphoribosylaminoimidazolesuccinocarboxamide synthase [Alistipes sp.]